MTRRGLDDVDAMVRRTLHEHARVPVDDLRADAVLGCETGVDSLALVRTLAALEDRLGVEFPLEHVENMRQVTLGEVVRVVHEALERSPATAPAPAS